MKDKYKDWLIVLGLTIVPLAVFWQVHTFEFINYDDDKYVSENQHVRSGLALENIIWVFTNEHVGNWHPMTGLSHILDSQLFDLNAGMHHLVNLLFHIANTLLLFIVLKQMTGARWRSAVVAVLFALHPLHVESVAWIAERKDVLSTLFWILTMAAYLHYVKNPKAGKYVLMLISFALGLMAKPMLVTLPFVLLLLDYWPLNRLETDRTGKIKWETCYHLIWEKTPLFILSAISSIITFLVQKSAGTISKIEVLSLGARVANAVISYVKYIIKMVCPIRLAVFYPHPGDKLPYWQIFFAGVLLAIITICALRFAARYKYLLTGWLWYLGTLIPVIGLIQVGGQAMADRYTYVPLTGLFIIIAWGTNDLLANWKCKTPVLSSLLSTVVLILAVLTWFQVSHWHDSIRLFTHAVRVTGGNNLAYTNRGIAYCDKGAYDLAIADFNKALEIKPKYAKAWYNRGNAYASGKGAFDLAIADYTTALDINPQLVDAYYNRGNIYKNKGEYALAISDYTKVIEINPRFAEAYNNRGNTYRSRGKLDLAIADFNKALEINPEIAETYNNRGNAYRDKGAFDLAISDYDKALELNPGLVESHFNKAIAYERSGRKAEAIEAYKTFIQHASSRYAPSIEIAKKKIRQLEQYPLSE